MNNMDQAREWSTKAARQATRTVERASHTDPARTVHAVSQTFESSVAHGPTNATWRSLFMTLAGASLVSSLGLAIVGRKHQALLVGQWTPSLLIFALWGQTVKEQR